ncbi:MAG: hypothetical protein ACYCV6_14795 [Steroidobacteraceae bacterium]
MKEIMTAALADESFYCIDLTSGAAPEQLRSGSWKPDNDESTASVISLFFKFLYDRPQSGAHL